MKFKKLNSSRLVDVNVAKYQIDWEREVSKPQKKVKDFLFPFWKHHVVLEEFMIPGSKLRVDLISLTTKIAVEVSPLQHIKRNKFFHKNHTDFTASLKRDSDKERWIKDSGFEFIELYDEDIKNLSKQWIKDKFNIDI